MKLGQEQLTKPINKNIKPSQVHFDDYSPTISPQLQSGEMSMDYLRKQYSEAKPFAARANAVLSNTFHSETKLFAKPLNLSQHSSLSYNTTYDSTPNTLAFPADVTPKNATSLGSSKFEKTMDSTSTQSFQQFLYDKFRKEYDETHSRQSLSGYELPARKSFDYSPVVPKTRQPLRSIEQKPSAGSPQVFKKEARESANKKSPISSPSPVRGSLPQQLIASNSTKLSPIKHGGSFDAKLHDVNRSPSLESLKARFAPDSDTAIRLSQKLAHVQDRISESKKHLPPIRLPKIAKPNGELVNKPTKSEIDRAKFHPYTLKDYRTLQQPKLGGIGPSYVGTEDWCKESNKRNRMAEYLKSLHPEGASTRSGVKESEANRSS
mmetsp:Transcript_17300/g.31154  ORF Transcript_17300/g.31154 Transcript_17300/m.31154 type:complete len:378 (+) Transcript_17300:897-2030(+)